jgi:hypothetical protein
MTLTNCNWEQMAHGADKCCRLLTNHKQTLTHKPHCLQWNILPSSCLQVNYFPYFQTLSADSSAKIVCASQQRAHRSPWIRQVIKKFLCIFVTAVNITLLYDYTSKGKLEQLIWREWPWRWTRHESCECKVNICIVLLLFYGIDCMIFG